MLNRIIAWALRQRLLVVALAVGVALVGTYSATRLPKDVLPDLGRPRVSILTEAHGYVAEDVEQLVTRPLEQAVAGTTGVVALRSTSSPGLSVVQVDFDWGSDLYRSRQLVQEKMSAAARELPEGLGPILAPISSLMGQVHMIGVRSKSGDTSAAEIRDLVDRDIRLRLLALPGVAQVVTTGGAPRQLQVTVKADLLRAHDVTLMDVAESIREANRNASGGLLPVGTQAPFVTATGFIKSPEDLASAVVRAAEPRSVLLSDVAEVDFGPAAIKVGEAGVDGNSGVIMVVLKQPGTDTLTLTARVDAELANISKTLAPDLEILPDLFRQSDFIERAVENVEEAVWLGGLLVVLVLVVFLLNVRTTIITLTAIPLSIAVTAIVFHAFDVAINTMTLGGLAVAIGALVDDAIVDVENVLRRLRQNRTSEKPRTGDAIVFLASSEVRGPILVGTLVVAAVYLPLFALTGMEGRLFRPVGVAYIVSIVASLVVALTVTPALCAWLLPRAGAVDRGDGPLVRALKSGGQKLIRLSTNHPIIICQLLGVLVLFSLGALSLRGTEFLPTFNEGTAQIDLILPADTSLETSDEYGRKLEQVVSAIPGVNRVGRRTGRAEGDEHVMGVGITEMVVTFDEDSGRTRGEVLGDIRHAMEEAFPGVPNAVEQPLGHLLSHLLSGVNAQVAIKIRGQDLPTLRRFGERIKQRVGTIPGVTDLLVEQQVLVDRVEIAPRRGDLARLGVRAGDLAETVELALEGEVVSRFLEGRMAWPIIVRLAADDRKNLEDLRSLVVAHGDAAPVTLADVADVRMSLTPNQVKHEDTGRRLVVSHNVEGRPLGDVVAEVRRELDVVRQELPTGYTIDVGGQFQAQEAAGRLIFLLSFVSLAIMFLTLFLHFRSVNLAIQVLLNIPAAFIGAAWLVIALDQTLSIATLVGLVSLGGIASRNGILLIDHYLHLMREEGMPFGPEMVIKAGRERLVPVLMTALTSGIALVPLLIAGHAPGRELLYPVATVIVGGLFSTTLLDLLLTPGVFLLFGRKAAERHVARAEVSDLERDQIAELLDRQARIAAAGG